MSPQPELRIGDDEREAAVTALGEHYAAGRLTKEEFDERSEQAWAARTASALMPLFADLPRPQAAATAPPGPVRRGPSFGPDRGHPGWRVAARTVLVVLLALFVLTHLPVILLLGVLCLLWVRTSRHRGRSRGVAHWQQHSRWVR